MSRSLAFALLALVLAPPTASAQVLAEPSVLAGVALTDRDETSPASPVFNAGLDVRIGVPAEGYQVPIDPFFGFEGNLMLIDEDTHSYEMMAAMRAGFRMDSPGYPRFFGFLGRAWPAPPAPAPEPEPEPEEGEEEAATPIVRQSVYGGGLSLRFGRVTVEGRYAYDKRWETGRRASFALLVGSTF